MFNTTYTGENKLNWMFIINSFKISVEAHQFFANPMAPLKKAKHTKFGSNWFSTYRGDVKYVKT